MFDHSKTPVFTAMKAYRERNVIPFDVPGHKHGRGLKEYKDYSVDINKCLHELVKEMIAKIANRYPHLQIGVVYLLSKAIVSSPDWVCKTYGAETFNIELTD